MLGAWTREFLGSLARDSLTYLACSRLITTPASKKVKEQWHLGVTAEVVLWPPQAEHTCAHTHTQHTYTCTHTHADKRSNYRKISPLPNGIPPSEDPRVSFSCFLVGMELEHRMRFSTTAGRESYSWFTSGRMGIHSGQGCRAGQVEGELIKTGGFPQTLPGSPPFPVL